MSIPKFSKELNFGGISVGENHPPFIIAEMSGNHNQSLDRALALVDKAAECGAHALKLQTYTADTMTLNIPDGDFYISDKNSLWHGSNLHALYEKAHTPWDWHKAIFDRAKEKGIICFSTPFDETAVDFLEELDAPFYKIASFENTHFPLIKKVIATKKPLIISTGMADLTTLSDIVDCLKVNGASQAVLLKCTSTYPASPKDTNTLTIPHMSAMFDIPVGLSDHTRGIGVALASVALGARVIEKHFTLDRDDGGVDSDFSLEPDELKALVVESKRAWEGLGQVHYQAVQSETQSKQFRRSVYVCEDVQPGDIFSEKNIRIIRPGYGLAPKHFEEVLGKKASKKLTRGTPLAWPHIVDGRDA